MSHCSEVAQGSVRLQTCSVPFTYCACIVSSAVAQTWRSLPPVRRSRYSHWSGVYRGGGLTEFEPSHTSRSAATSAALGGAAAGWVLPSSVTRTDSSIAVSLIVAASLGLSQDARASRW